MKSILFSDEQLFELNRLCANEIHMLRAAHDAAALSGDLVEQSDCDILIVDLMAIQSQLAG